MRRTASSASFCALLETIIRTGAFVFPEDAPRSGAVSPPAMVSQGRGLLGCEDRAGEFPEGRRFGRGGLCCGGLGVVEEEGRAGPSHAKRR
ncbi:MAG: hypothetical protein R3B46_06530 [Phycisphaerales bacterium]